MPEACEREVLVLTSADAISPEAERVLRSTEQGSNVSLGAMRRLGKSGAEFELRARSPNALADVRLAMSRLAVDANIIARRRREKRLMLADMDSTIIPVECIDEVARRAGVGDEVAAITARAMRGEMPFPESVKERLALCRGLPVGELEAIWNERIRLNPGAATLVRTMRERGAKCALVSGGYTYFAERVAEQAGFSEFRANTLEIKDGVLSGGLVPPILDRSDKLGILKELCRSLGIAKEETLAIGDGANDADMVRAAGLGVAWRGKPLLRAAATAWLDFSNLDAALYLQGISEECFVKPGSQQ